MNGLSRRQLLATFVPSLLVLSLVAAVRLLTGVQTSLMTGDMASTLEANPLTGFVSNLGVLLWGASATACLFAAFVVRGRGDARAFRFLLVSSVLSAYLTLDDLFLIHDDLAGRYLGLPEKAVFAILGVAVAAYFVAFRQDIVRTGPTMLLLALGLFALSVALDLFVVDSVSAGHGMYFLEDGSKWLGVACWCSYWVRTSYQAVTGPVTGVD